MKINYDIFEKIVILITLSFLLTNLIYLINIHNNDKEPVKQEFFHDEIQLKIVYGTEYCKYKVSPDAIGCTEYSKNDNICTIYIENVTYVNDRSMTTWGHELYHCVHGGFHE